MYLFSSAVITVFNVPWCIVILNEHRIVSGGTVETECAFYVLSCYYKTSRQSTYSATNNSITVDPVVSTEDLYLKVSSCIILAKWELCQDNNTKSFPEFYCQCVSQFVIIP